MFRNSLVKTNINHTGHIYIVWSMLYEYLSEFWTFLQQSYKYMSIAY